MEKIIGREDELGKLKDYYQSEKSEFIAVYGRRRVGKTFLIRSFFKDKFDFYATGVIDGSRDVQKEAFHSALVRYGYKGKKATTWIEAFNRLAELLESKNKGRKKRMVVFIDEFLALIRLVQVSSRLSICSGIVEHLRLITYILSYVVLQHPG